MDISRGNIVRHEVRIAGAAVTDTVEWGTYSIPGTGAVLGYVGITVQHNATNNDIWRKQRLTRFVFFIKPKSCKLRLMHLVNWRAHCITMRTHTFGFCLCISSRHGMGDLHVVTAGLVAHVAGVLGKQVQSSGFPRIRLILSY